MKQNKLQIFNQVNAHFHFGTFNLDKENIKDFRKKYIQILNKNIN